MPGVEWSGRTPPTVSALEPQHTGEPVCWLLQRLSWGLREGSSWAGGALSVARCLDFPLGMCSRASVPHAFASCSGQAVSVGKALYIQSAGVFLSLLRFLTHLHKGKESLVQLESGTVEILNFTSGFKLDSIIVQFESVYI